MCGSDTDILCLPATVFGLPRFQFVDLGTLGGTNSSAIAVSDTGYVAGNSTVASGGTRAFRWYDGSMQNLGLLPMGDLVEAPESTAVDVNNAGNVVGNGAVLIEGTETQHAFWFGATDTQMQFLISGLSSPGVGRSTVTSINNSNVAVGSATLEVIYQEDASVYVNPPGSNPSALIDYDDLGTWAEFITDDNIAFVYNRTPGFTSLATPLGHAADVLDGFGLIGGGAPNVKGANSNYRYITGGITPCCGVMHNFFRICARRKPGTVISK